MADQLEAQPPRGLALQLLDVLVLELDDLARVEIDQVIVVLVGGLLVAGAAVAEIVVRRMLASSRSRTVRYTVAIEIFGFIAEARR